jgi:hypothetical protein
VVARRGRGTSSPPQLGQTWSIVVAQSGQNVHSKLQIVAAESWARGAAQRSQAGRISSMAATL